MTAINKTLCLSVALGSLIISAGCAVLRVDVDVYKGPLANNEEVQEQQIIATAVAAERMLNGLEEVIDEARKKEEQAGNAKVPKYSRLEQLQNII